MRPRGAAGGGPDEPGRRVGQLRADAERFRALHRAEAPLVIPNAWDASSAAAFVTAGFVAVATSSGAIARSLGHEDGERTPVDEMFAAVTRVVAGAWKATTPSGAGVRSGQDARERPLVSADVEAGYGLPAAVLVERLANAGVVGFNVEDSDPHTGELVPLEAQAERIAALKAAADAAGTGLVINARVDLHVRAQGDDSTRLERSIARARAYLAAGADCVFPIMLAAEPDIAGYVREVPGPVNIMATRAAPPLPRLLELGVQRISFGSGFHRHSLEALSAAAQRALRGEQPWG